MASLNSGGSNGAAEEPGEPMNTCGALDLEEILRAVLKHLAMKDLHLMSR